MTGRAGSSATSSAPPAAEERLELSRRADWRFLLPDPRLRRVLALGAIDGAQVASLCSLAASVEVAAGPPPAAHGPFDVVVAAADAVEPGAARVAPGGWLYVEVEQRGARALAAPARAVARRLERAGFQDVRRHWHWPSFSACAEIVPLGDRAGVSLALARRRSGRSSRPKAVLAAACARLGLLERIVPCVSVCGRRPDGGR